MLSILFAISWRWYLVIGSAIAVAAEFASERSCSRCALTTLLISDLSVLREGPPKVMVNVPVGAGAGATIFNR